MINKNSLVAELVPYLIKNNLISKEETSKLEIKVNDTIINQYKQFKDYPEVVDQCKVFIKLEQNSIKDSVLASKDCVPQMHPEINCSPDMRVLS